MLYFHYVLDALELAFVLLCILALIHAKPIKKNRRCTYILIIINFHKLFTCTCRCSSVSIYSEKLQGNSDLPAKAAVLNSIQFNGFCGCP